MLGSRDSKLAQGVRIVSAERFVTCVIMAAVPIRDDCFQKLTTVEIFRYLVMQVH